MTDAWTFTSDPVWPWSTSGYGTLGLMLVALVLGGLTLWTYLGVGASARRTLIVLVLRFFALFLAILALMRPAVASRDDLKVPSVLIILGDGSESMTIHDEYGGLSRWDALRKILEKCEPTLQSMAEDQNVTVVRKRFAEALGDLDLNRPADGKRTDVPIALEKLFAEYSNERFLRGVIVLSDGANNGAGDALKEAEQFRRRSCPVHTFTFGQRTSPAKQRDVAIVSITPTPAPVPVKNKLEVAVNIDAPGFENTQVPVRLFIDDKEVTVQQKWLTESTGNEVKLVTVAPDKPGEIKVTVRVEPPVGDAIHHNNEISTYVTVAKEGLSVLYIDRLREERIAIVRALRDDPRIRLDEMIRQDEEPLSPEQAKALRFDTQHYDVIIIGDVSARRLSGGDPSVLVRVHSEVTKFGAGLLMLGGFETFTGDWKGTPIAEILPVDLGESGVVDPEVRLLPTKQGLDRYIMRLDPDAKKSAELWNALPKVGVVKMGKEKPGAVVLARANDPVGGMPVIVSQEVGAHRTVAFAADTARHWQKFGLNKKPPERTGMEAYSRFWKQLALWLAKQEEASGNVWVRPDARRLAAGAKQGFTVGLRGKSGVDLTDAKFTVNVIGPDKVEHPIAVNREAAGQRGVFWKTERTGEYRIVVRGEGVDGDGKPISGEASARFLVYQDAAELARQAADYEFMARLAAAGGGKAFRAEELPRFMQEMRSQPLPQQARAKTDLYPDWRRSRLSLFLPGFLLLFASVLCLEWFLRRSWGMV